MARPAARSIRGPMALLAALAQSDVGLTSGASVDAGTLTLMAGALGMIALCSIGSVIRTRRALRSAARRVRREGGEVQAWLRSIRLAHGGGDVALWQYDPHTGQQQWSGAMRRLFGIDHGDAFVLGDAETLLCARGVDLVAQATQSAAVRVPYTLEYELADPAGPPRFIRGEICNLFDGDGALVRVVAVLREHAGPAECAV